MSQGGVVLEVIIFGAKGLVGSQVFTVPQISVGRDPRAMVRLDDPSVSLRHAVLAFDGDSVRVRDVGSRTGTWLNGRSIDDDSELGPTDELVVGTFRLRLSIHRPAAVEDARRRPRQMSVPTPLEEFVPGAPAPGGYGAVDPLEEGSAEARDTAPTLTRAADVHPKTDPPPQPSSDVDALLADALAFGPAAGEREPGPPLGILPILPSTARAFVRDDERERDDHEAPKRELGGQREREREDYRSEREDDEDDEDAGFVPPFDMLAALSRSAKAPLLAGSGSLAVEVVHFREDLVLSLQHIGKDGSIRVARGQADLEIRERAGSFELHSGGSEGFSVKENDRPLRSESQSTLDGGGAIPIVPGTRLQIALGDGEGLLVHVVSCEPALSVHRPSLKTQGPSLAMGAASAVTHVAVLAIVGLALLGGKTADAEDINAGRFATISLKDVEIEPPPPPPPEDPPVPTETPIPSPTPERRAQHQPTTSGAPASPAARAERDPAPSASALKLLKALGSPSASGPQPIALASLDAMPHARSGFKVSDVVGKAPGDTLRATSLVADAQVNTKSAAEVGADVGRVHAKTGDSVRARVTAAPQAIGGEGHLDRGEIQRVVNAHLFQVQGCYERQLMKDPSLGGKATFQWVIGTSGSTGGVRVAQSSIHSVEVLTCIQTAIQRWTFPAPEGGSVTVTYPFAFTSGS
jgi:outer membrane biosynthesis protein TonB